MTTIRKISIRDSGVGMHPARMIAVFHNKPYTQGEDRVGLGLLLCRELVERQNGRIWCVSEPGKGTTVTFTLPTAQPNKE